MASANTAESLSFQHKRALIGAWHHVSRDYLARFANEFAFRWNTRHDPDGIRLANSSVGSKAGPPGAVVDMNHSTEQRFFDTLSNVKAKKPITMCVDRQDRARTRPIPSRLI